jgi:hypothetical protein
MNHIDHQNVSFPLSLTILGITLPRCRHINFKQNLESKRKTTYNGQGGGKPTIVGQRGLLNE